MTAAHDLAILRTTSLPASDGSSLVGFLQSGTGATARTVQAKLRDVVSVKDFGAVGDGVTDDTAAIQAAITKTQNDGGGQILFPPGNYIITATLTLSGAVGIWLVGTWGSRISNNGTGTAIVVGNTSADQTSDVQIKGLLIYGNASSSHGIHMKRMHSSTIEYTRVRNCGGDGIRMEACYASRILNSYSNNNSGNGITAVAISGVGCDFIHIIGNFCLANGGKGIYIDNRLYGPSGQRVERNDMEGNAIGFQLDVGSSANTESFSLLNNYFENNTGYNVSIAEDGGSSVINSPLVSGNAFNFGTVSSSANAVRFGSKVRQLTLLANDFVTCDLVIDTSATIGIVGGNKGSVSFPGGFDNNGGVTVSQLRLWQPGGGAYSAISMVSGLIAINYPTQWNGPIYPQSASTGTYQNSCGIYSGTGAPSNTYGASGDVYFRSDTPATANQRIYIKNGGTWTGIV